MRRKFLIAGALSIVMIGGLFLLYPVMTLRLEDYINRGADLPLGVRILYGVSLFWRTFWWLLTPSILVANFGIAMLIERFFWKRR